MEGSFILTDKTYDAIQTLFVGDITPKEKSCPDCRCIRDFFANLWDNKTTVLNSAIVGSVALVIHYSVELPLPTGIFIGSSATLALVAICNSLHLRPAALYTRDSNNSSYLINENGKRSNSEELEQMEQADNASPSTTHSYLSISTVPQTVEDPPSIRAAFNPFAIESV